MNITRFFKDFVAYLNIVSLMLLVGSLAFGYIDREVFIVFFYASFVLDYLVNARFRVFHFDKAKIYYLLIIFFAMMFFLYLPFETDKPLTADIFGSRRLHLIIWSVIGLLGLNDKFRFKYIPISIVIGALFTILYLVLGKIGCVEFIKSPERASIFRLARIEFVGTHMIFNFYLNLALISIFYLIYNYTNKIHFLLKTGLFLCGELFFFFLMITEGRSGFLSALFIVFFMICVATYKKYRSVAILIFINIPLMIALFSSQHARINEKKFKDEARFFLWEISAPLIKEKPVLGRGANQSMVDYNKARVEKQNEAWGYMWQNESYIDPHNQYIHTLMELGLVGLALLLGIYLLPWFLAAPQERIFLLFFIPLSMFQSLFDNFLTGQAFGITFLLLIIAIHQEKYRRLIQ